MQRLAILVAVAALAALAWWFARPDAGGAAEGLVVHVLVLDRDGAPVHPAQVVQVYDDTRTTVDTQGRATLTSVTLRAGDEPSAEAFGYALKPLARHHALRRGFEPTASRRADGSWEVRYALHPHGILRVHVEAVNLGRGKAFLERDEPLQRWEPVGGHAVVRPGSIVDFRIYGGWDLAGGDGTLAVRLEGEPGADGLVAMASQRLRVDAPSPGHTAQLTIVPEPVDPIAGVVRVPEGPPPPTLRGRMLVRHVLADGSRVPLGEIPIDDEGGFTFRDAGPGRYELVAGLDFVPGLITTETSGGSYLELETPGRARWVELEHPGLDSRRARVDVEVQTTQGGRDRFPRTVLDERVAPYRTRIEAQVEGLSGLLPAGERAAPAGWSVAPRVDGDGRTQVALPGPGPWTLRVQVAGDARAGPRSAVVDVRLPDDASSATLAVPLQETAARAVSVRVADGGWGNARSVVVELGRRKATLVKDAKESVVLEGLPATSLTGSVRWGASDLPEGVLRVAREQPEIVLQATPGGELELRLAGPRAQGLTLDVAVLLEGPDPTAPRPMLTLHRTDATPVWRSSRPAPTGTWRASLVLVAPDEPPLRAPDGTLLLEAAWSIPCGTDDERTVVIEAGSTTILTCELAAE